MTEDDEPLEDLVTLYCDRRLSLTQIAAQIGCPVTRVRDSLRACGVTLRIRQSFRSLARVTSSRSARG